MWEWVSLAPLLKNHPWVPKFLANLREGRCVKSASEATGISRAMVYKLRNSYPWFREAIDDAKDDAIEDLQSAVWKRALNKGGTRAAIFLLRSLRPEVFRAPKCNDPSHRVRFADYPSPVDLHTKGVNFVNHRSRSVESK